MSRRRFHSAALAALGASACAPSAATAGPKKGSLPTVVWGKHKITRLLVGHNPVKGFSHYNRALDQEMRRYHSDNHLRGRRLLRRCQEFGINTCQMGAPTMEALLRAHYAEGGSLRWIATLYSEPGKGKDELKRILQMNPKPIGVQSFGNVSDALMHQGKIDRVLENLKMLRDAGVLVGLCSHNHEVIDYAESKGWDLDFYQCCFYHSVFGLDGRREEVFEDEHRRAMARTIRQVSKPCIAYKVLGANRHCRTPADVERALRFAFENIKPSDVVLVGMWQKYKDQVAENTALTRKILGVE